MAKTTQADTIIILDDEMYNLTWLIDYLYSKKFSVVTSGTANDALSEIDKEIYRAAIIDLNVPLLSPEIEAAKNAGEVYAKFPGLYVAKRARNRGYRDRQVIIYSVHRDETVNEEAKKLGCTYILKGRPKEMKEEIEAVLSYDPTG